ncbi:MAG: hypothetical protein E6X17_06120 [Sporomusaceae bacterium]|nr:hypothetical protein [Sporomusaceae bacterium]
MEKFDLCNDLKEEIESYTSMLNIANTSIENDIRNITKRLLFLKTVVSRSSKDHYPKFLIYDLLSLMHALKQNSKRNVYNLYRSAIENFVRFALELDDVDGTGVRKIFDLFKEKFSISPETIEIINFIEGEYSGCCDFVHSNQRAGLSIAEHYQDILSNDDMNDQTIKQITKRIVTFLQKITLLLIYVSPDFVDGSFYRSKQKLKYLIGEGNYRVLRENVS